MPLSKHFGQVIAWDPDPEMLKQAKRKTAEKNIKNIIFEQKSSDDLPELKKKIKLCAMGRSFHWMDGTDTLIEIKKHLADGGGVAIVDIRHGLHIYSPTFSEPDDITAERNRIVSEIGKKYLGTKRKAGHSLFTKEQKSFNEMLDEVGFSKIKEVIFDTTVTRTIDDTVGFILSSSWGNKNQLGDKAEIFEQELRSRLITLKPDGLFNEKLTFWLLTARS